MTTRDKILRAVAAANGEPITLRALARQAGVSHPAVAGHLRRLERDGFVRRDARGTLRLRP